jgi:hypothetical protein
MTDQLKIGFLQKMGNITPRLCKEIVQAHENGHNNLWKNPHF